MIAGRCLICGELSGTEIARISERSDQDIVIASPSKSMRRPACLAELAWHRFLRGDSDELATLSPIYIHPDS
jgi:tRNA threonylcarbamoyladenosine biosynthesis protein TsaB